jgi:PAS domain S-box-containing protein
MAEHPDTSGSATLHPLLRRQLAAVGAEPAGPPGPAAWHELVSMVSTTYEHMVRERELVRVQMESTERELRRLHTDVTARCQQLTAVVASLDEGVIVLDSSHLVEHLNPEAERLLQAPAAELLGRPFWEVAAALRPVDRKGRDVLSEMEAAAREGTPWRADDVHGIVAGDQVTLSVTVTPVLGAGTPTGTVIAVRDVTERSRLEVELRHATKLEAVGQLAAGIAHEINTPIQFIGDNVTFLAEGFRALAALVSAYQAAIDPNGPPRSHAERLAELRAATDAADLEYLLEEVPAAVAQTLEGVERVATIVRAMKAFGHPDTGQRTPADLNAAIANTLVVARNETKYVADVSFDPGELPMVPCYLGDLNQVFLNLLINAAHAVGDKMAATGERGRIRLRTYRDGDDAVIEVADTGCGIPPEIADRVFDPFFTTKEVGRGTGQGLALARAVVDRHGGTITFDSRVGEGTTFRVRLPIEPVAEPVAEPARP